MKRFLSSCPTCVMFVLLASLLAVPAVDADVMGSIFLTGHDPDFHANEGANALGAQHINQAAINFIMNPTFNPFVAGGDKQFLFVECDTCPVPAGHVDGVPGINGSLPGFPAGTTFETHGAADGLATALTQLGTKYSAIVIGSDFGGMLTQADLSLLDADSAGIVSFLNNGGGLYAMAETAPAENGLASTGFYGFLPFVVSASPLNLAETGYTLTPFGVSLGLTTTDINGNFSHNVFTSAGGLNIVDLNPGKEIVSLAGRGKVPVVPEPGSVVLLGSVLLVVGALVRRKIKA